MRQREQRKQREQEQGQEREWGNGVRNGNRNGNGIGNMNGNGIAVRTEVRFGVGIEIEIRIEIGIGIRIGIRIKIGVRIEIRIRVRIGVGTRVRIGIGIGIRIGIRVRIGIRGDSDSTWETSGIIPGMGDSSMGTVGITWRLDPSNSRGDNRDGLPKGWNSQGWQFPRDSSWRSLDPSPSRVIPKGWNPGGALANPKLLGMTHPNFPWSGAGIPGSLTSRIPEFPGSVPEGGFHLRGDQLIPDLVRAETPLPAGGSPGIG